MIVQGSHAIIGVELTRLEKREKGKGVFFSNSRGEQWDT